MSASSVCIRDEATLAQLRQHLETSPRKPLPENLRRDVLAAGNTERRARAVAAWTITWDGADEPVTGKGPTLPEARMAAEAAAAAIRDLWQRPGAAVRITGPSGGIWCLQPTRQKVGKVSWTRASRRTSRVPEPVREISGIDIPRLLQRLGAQRHPDHADRPDPLCCEAAAAIKALGGAAA